MKKINKILSAVAATFALSGNTYAETTLHVASWLPPSHPQNAVVIPTWAKWIEDATNGEVKVKVEYNIGHPKDLFTLVEDGVVEAAWSSTGYVPGRFNLTQLAELPLKGANAEATSVAYWQTHQKYFSNANEFTGVEVVGLFTHAPGQIHTREPIQSLSDLEGKKIRLGGGVMNTLAERIGAVGVSAPAPKVYEMLQQGVIDGTFLPVCEQRVLRLNEIARNLTLLPGGMYQTSFAFIMNQDFLDSLSTKSREAILNVSGERLSRLAGYEWEKCGDDALKESIAKGVVVKKVEKGDPIDIEFEKITEGLDEAWIDSVKDTGIDVKAALADFRKTAYEYEAKKGN